MAEEDTEKKPAFGADVKPPPNAFDGMTFGQAVLKLKKFPDGSLDKDFDAKFKDEEEFNALERARLHQVHAYYRGSTAGASWLEFAYNQRQQVETGKSVDSGLSTSPYPVGLTDLANPAKLATAIGKSISQGYLYQTPEQVAEQYDKVVVDLAKYAQMRSVFGDDWELRDPGGMLAALSGAVSGGVLGPENLISAPFRVAGPIVRAGWTKTANVVEGAFQGALMNVVTDPYVQLANMAADIQKDYDWTQTVLSAPLGAVFGGGMVGAGQVLSRGKVKETVKVLATEDKGFRQPDQEFEVTPIVKPEEAQVQAREINKEIREDLAAVEPLKAPTETKAQETYEITSPLGSKADDEVWSVDVVRNAEGLPETLYSDQLGVVKIPKNIQDKPIEEIISQVMGDNSEFVKVQKVATTGDNIAELQAQIVKLTQDYTKAAQEGAISGDFTKATNIAAESHKINQQLETLKTQQTAPELLGMQTKTASKEVPEVLALTADETHFVNTRESSLPSEAQEALSSWRGANYERMEDAFSANPSAKGQQLRQQLETAFAPIREEWRKKYGDTIVLWRGAGGYVSEYAEARNLLSFTDKTSVAEKFASGQIIWKRTVDLDDVVWITGKYDPNEHEFIVKTGAGVPLAADAKIKKGQLVPTYNTSVAQALPNLPEGKIGELERHTKMRDYTKDELDWEFHTEYEKYTKPKFPNAFTTREDFQVKYDAAPLRHLSVEELQNLENSMASSGLGKGEQWVHQEFGHRRDVYRIFDDLNKGETAPPIILEKDGRLHLMAGQTRLAAGLATNRSVPVKVISLDAEGRAIASAATKEPTFDQPIVQPRPQSEGRMIPFEEEIKPEDLLAGQSRGNIGVKHDWGTGERQIVKSQQTLVQDLQRDFDVDIRQGRLRLKQVEADYSTKIGTVRTKNFTDFEVAVHETGHKIHNDLGFVGSGKPFDNMLKRWDSELEPLDYAYDPITGGRYYEGWSEWLRVFIGNPAAAQKAAPGFTAEFLNFMEMNQPEILKKLIQTHKNYEKYLTASSVDVLAATVTKPKTWMDSWRTTLQQQGLPGTIDRMVAGLYKMIWDQINPAARVRLDIAKDFKTRTGQLMQDVAPSEDAVMSLRRAARTGIVADEQFTYGAMQRGTFEPTGPSGRDAIQAAHGADSMWGKWDDVTYNDFEHYLVAREAMLRWEQHAAGKLDVEPFAQKPNDVATAINDLEAKYPQFVHAAEMWSEFRQNYYKRFTDARPLGVTQEVADAIMATNHYASMMRDVTDKPMIGAGGPRDGDTPAIKGFRGSTRNVLSPIEEFKHFMDHAEHVMHYNDTMRGFETLARRGEASAGKWIEIVDAKEMQKEVVKITQAFDDYLKKHGISKAEREAWKASMSGIAGDEPLFLEIWKSMQTHTRGEPIMFYSDKNGQLAALRLSSNKEDPIHGLFELMQKMPKPHADFGLKLLEAGTHMAQQTIVRNPFFALVDWTRAEIQAWGQIPGYRIPFSGLVELPGVLANTEASRRYRRAGGVEATGALYGHEDVTQGTIKQLSMSGWQAKLMTWKGLGELISSLEQSTRNRAFSVTYRRAKQQGLSDYDANVTAAQAATDLYDYGRNGSHVLELQRMTPFLRAALNGLDTYRRTLGPAYNYIWNASSELLHKAASGKPLTKQDLTIAGKYYDTDAQKINDAFTANAKLIGILAPIGFAWAHMNWDKENYQLAKPDLLGKNFITEIGNRVIFIPKPFEFAAGFTVGEALYRKYYQNDPRAAEVLAKSLLASIEPPVPIVSNPLIRLPTELATNTRLFDWGDWFAGGSPIVPKSQQKVAKPEQQTLNTSPMAKTIAKTTGQSPIKVDHIIGSMFNEYGRWAQDLSRATESEEEIVRLEDNSLLRRWRKDPKFVNASVQKFYDYMAATAGKYVQAANTYEELKKRPDGQNKSRAYFETLSDNEKVWVTLQRAGSASNTKDLAFKPEDRAVHPFERANIAIKTVRDLDNAVALNNVKDAKGQPVVMSPWQRKQARETLNQLYIAEFRNALVIAKEPGWADKTLIGLDQYMEQLELNAPDLAKELKYRYAEKKIFKTERVAEAYEPLKSEVLAGGSAANIRPITSAVKFTGYEFDGARVKRRPTPRQVIEGTRQ